LQSRGVVVAADTGPADSPRVNTTDDAHQICETEPIHLPGSVMPHGALLVLSTTGVVLAASASCAGVLSTPADELVGSTVTERFGAPAAAQFDASITAASDRAPASCRFVTGTPAGQSVECRAHLCGDHVLLDIEPWEPAKDRAASMIHAAVLGITALRTCSDPVEIARRLAVLAREMTGFDRVLVYRFDDEWNGEVIAEARAEFAPSYLGLNFPASDIPAQARELYRTVEVRQIPDALYVPSPVVSNVGPVDLGASGLRSVSPFHLEYMHNMGVRASLVGSVLQQDRLWGLIACHQLQQPRRLSGAERDAFQLICQTASALMTNAEAGARAARAQTLERHQARLLDAVHDNGIEGLMAGDCVADLLGVVGADGFAFIGERGVRCVGSTPAPAQVQALHDVVAARGDAQDIFVTHSLRDDLDIVDAEGRVAGAILLPVMGRHGIPLMWFRDERKRSVHWGGDPRRAVEIDERGVVSPRKSFATFLENIEGQSLHWSPEEVDSAHRLKELIEVEVQRILRVESDLLREALTSLNEMVLITEAEPIASPGPRIVMVSKALEQFTGYTASELIGQSPRILQGPLTDRAELDRLRAALERWERVRVEVVNYRKDGRAFWVELDIAPIADETGWFTHWICVQRDVTERRRAAVELEAQRDRMAALADAWREAKDDADRANDAKSLFLANMSHELRTPMHAIMSFSRLGLERAAAGDTERLARYFGNINESGARLTVLLNDLLDLSKLEAGRMDLQKVPTDLAVVVAQCAAEFDPLLEARSLRLSFDRPAEPIVASVDPIRIGQVLRNLLANAIKFSHDGGCVEVAITRVAATDTAAASVRLTVDDAGVGIPEDELEVVFDKFVQSSKTRTSSGGTGLGLAICRELVGAHGGSIRALQRTPLGTRFEVVLPVG
jgi:PAS domain S-box-containing protein